MFIRFLSIFSLFLMPCIVYAQDGGSAIQVIQEDGGIQSLEIPQNTPVQKAEPKMPSFSTEELLQKMEQAIPEEEKKVAPVQNAVKEQPAQKDKLEAKEKVLEKMKPPAEVKSIKKTVQKKQPAKKTIEKKVKTRKKTASKQARHIPSDVIPVPLSSKPEKRVITAQEKPFVMNKDEALRIALDHAPPSRGFTVFENRSYKDKIVYQVTFKTENGPHDILIDSKTGQVLKR